MMVTHYKTSKINAKTGVSVRLCIKSCYAKSGVCGINIINYAKTSVGVWLCKASEPHRWCPALHTIIICMIKLGMWYEISQSCLNDCSLGSLSLKIVDNKTKLRFPKAKLILMKCGFTFQIKIEWADTDSIYVCIPRVYRERCLLCAV